MCVKTSCTCRTIVKHNRRRRRNQAKTFLFQEVFPMDTNAFFHPGDVFPYRPISRRWMMMYIITSFMFFTKFNRWIKSKSMKSNWLKENILLSFVHALICSIILLIAVIRAPEFFQDPLSHANHFNYALIAFSIGYFAYDFLDCIRHSSQSLVGIVIHHIVAIVFLSHVLYQTRNIGYAIYGLSLEINSVFLHARRLIRWYSPVTSSTRFNHRIKIFVDIGNYLTFILFRFGVVIIGLRAVYIQRDRLHPVTCFCTASAGVAIGIINLILFYRLNKNCFRRKL